MLTKRCDGNTRLSLDDGLQGTVEECGRRILSDRLCCVRCSIDLVRSVGGGVRHYARVLEYRA